MVGIDVGWMVEVEVCNGVSEGLGGANSAVVSGEGDEGGTLLATDGAAWQPAPKTTRYKPSSNPYRKAFFIIRLCCCVFMA